MGERWTVSRWADYPRGVEVVPAKHADALAEAVERIAGFEGVEESVPPDNRANACRYQDGITEKETLFLAEALSMKRMARSALADYRQATSASTGEEE